MYVLKFFLMSCFFFSFVSCKNGTNYCSTSYDKRCVKLQNEAYKKGIETGVCYDIPEDGPIMSVSEAERFDPNPEACRALLKEARIKCRALPDDPDSIVVTSGSSFDRGGKSVCDPD